MMKNGKMPSWAWLLIAIGGFTLIAVAMLPNFNAMFLIAYLFGVLAIATVYYALQLCVKHGRDAKSQFYGFPILRIGAGYGAIQLALSFLSMALSEWIPLAVAAPIFAVLFALAAAGLAATSVARDEIKRQDNELKKNVSNMRSLQSTGNMLVTYCQDPALKQEVKKLAEALRYSDPVSSPALEAVEYDLSACMVELQRSLMQNDTRGASELCTRAMSILAERNRQCKLNK